MINKKEDYSTLSTKYRRELHRIPELDLELPKTKAYILSVLKELDCEIIPVLKSGVIAYFDRGQNNTIGFRADMDALPIEEISSLPFVSVHRGKMHACGHDGHMAMCLGLAKWLDTEKKLNANVLIIFQPGEESSGGALPICNTGVLQRKNVTEIFGLHMWPNIEAGKIISKSGPLQPLSSQIDFTVHGKSAHATAPEKGIDSIYISSQLITSIKKKHLAFLNERGYHDDCGGGFSINPPKAEDRTIIQICSFHGGSSRNVIPAETTLCGTVRAFSFEDFQSLINLIKDIVNKTEKRFSCKIKFNHSTPYPPVINDRALYESAMKRCTAANISVENMHKPAMISEDFSNYGEVAPYNFFFIGTGMPQGLHSNNFNLNEKGLINGLKLYAALIKGY